MKGYGEALEEMFYFFGIIFTPSTGTLFRYVLKTFDRVSIPTPKGLNDKRHKSDSLAAAIVKVGLILRRFSHLDGGGQEVGSPVDRNNNKDKK